MAWSAFAWTLRLSSNGAETATLMPSPLRVPTLVLQDRTLPQLGDIRGEGKLHVGALLGTSWSSSEPV